MTKEQMTVVTSSKSDEWSTPQDFFDAVDAEFGFTVDACASEENARCERFFSVEDDGLSKTWEGEIVWCNPPYSQTGRWVEKAAREGKKKGTVIVMLVAARTDVRWFHEFVYGKAEVRFIRGRLKFGGCKDNAPFPSMLVIFGKKIKGR